MTSRARTGIGGAWACAVALAVALAGCSVVEPSSYAGPPVPAGTAATQAAASATVVPAPSAPAPTDTPAPPSTTATPVAPTPTPTPDCRGAKDARTSKAQPFVVCGIVVVSKNHRITKAYVPDLTPVGLRLAVVSSASLTPDATAALRALFQAAKAKGHTLAVRFAYRSYALQDQMYQPGETYTAPPGASEHQTGLAVDLAAVVSGKQVRGFAFGTSSAGKWVRAHAHEYGFILRYPSGGEKSTGYPYEPWHLRYVGADEAAKIKASGLTLEQYLRIA